MLAHVRHQLVVGIEDGETVARHRFHDDPLHGGQLLDRMDLLQPEVVARHVEDHGDVVPFVAQALAQDPAPRHLEHGEVDPRVLEHHLGGLRPAGVGLPNQPLVDVDAVR